MVERALVGAVTLSLILAALAFSPRQARVSVAGGPWITASPMPLGDRPRMQRAPTADEMWLCSSVLRTGLTFKLFTGSETSSVLPSPLGLPAEQMKSLNIKLQDRETINANGVNWYIVREEIRTGESTALDILAAEVLAILMLAGALLTWAARVERKRLANSHQ